MTVSVIYSELLILLLPNFVWWYTIISQSVCEKVALLHSLMSRTQRMFQTSLIVCLADIFWTIERFVAKWCVGLRHHEPEFLCVKRLFCYLQGHGHNGGSYNQNMIIFRAADHFATKLSMIIPCLITMFTMKVTVMFKTSLNVSPIFFVPLIVLQPTRCVVWLITNDPTLCKQVGIVYRL